MLSPIDLDLSSTAVPLMSTQIAPTSPKNFIKPVSKAEVKETSTADLIIREGDGFQVNPSKKRSYRGYSPVASAPVLVPGGIEISVIHLAREAEARSETTLINHVFYELNAILGRKDYRSCDIILGHFLVTKWSLAAYVSLLSITFPARAHLRNRRALWESARKVVVDTDGEGRAKKLIDPLG